MELYHQTGHNECWNLDSYIEDKTGDGLILSPVNIKYKKLIKLSDDVKCSSFFDPQFYLPKECKSKLATYDFFPANLVNVLQTVDFEEIKNDVAKLCIDFQLENNFRFIVIPARYYEDIPNNYYEQLKYHFIEPFLNYYLNKKNDKEILLTVIVNQSQLMNEDYRYELLNRITGIQEIDGIYLIFENNSVTKQIKNAEYLFNALMFIKEMKLNDFKVHIGYNNTEGLLYSIANPDSISMGSYENLRSFGVDRFKIEKSRKNQPNPRLYSRKLLQWIEYGYIGAIKNLYHNAEIIFEDTRYKPLMFEPSFKWNFQRNELYKHFFIIFNSQIKELPKSAMDRIHYLKTCITDVLTTFDELKDAGVMLDENSDGTHLNFWLTCINMYEKYLKENSYEV